MSNEARLCVGTAQLGLPYGIANRVGKVEIEGAIEIMRFAVTNGVTLFDTAQAYGDSEERIGLAIERLGIEEAVQVITKLRPDFSFSTYELLQKSVLESIRRLHVPRLLGLLLHRSPDTPDWDFIGQSVARLKQEALIENFGVSICHPDEVARLMDVACVDIIQLPFNVLDKRWINRDVFGLARRNGKRIFLRSVYLQGLVFLNSHELTERNMEWAVPYVELVRRYTEGRGMSVRSFALQVALRQSPDTKVVIGVEKVEQLKENLRAMEDRTIGGKVIDEWWQQLPDVPERVINPSLWAEN